MEPTKVFISWSGERSKQLALALRDWLDDVLQSIEPWMSDQDIGAGRLWGPELDAALEGSFYGIICVTPDNPEKPWLNYEAGALAKKLSVGAVVPYLLGMDPTELPSVPLSRFQCAKADEQGTWEVLVMLNKSRDTHAMSNEKLRRSFDQWWPALNAKIEAIPPRQLQMKARTSEDKLDELIEGVRQLARDSGAIQQAVTAAAGTSAYGNPYDLAKMSFYRDNLDMLRISPADHAIATFAVSPALRKEQINVTRVEAKNLEWTIDFAVAHRDATSTPHRISLKQAPGLPLSVFLEFVESGMTSIATMARSNRAAPVD